MKRTDEDRFSELIYAKLAQADLHREELDSQFKEFGLRPGDVRGAEDDALAYEAIYESINIKTVA